MKENLNRGRQFKVNVAVSIGTIAAKGIRLLKVQNCFRMGHSGPLFSSFLYS